MMVTVVSPRWMVCAEVVMVRVTLQEEKARVSAQMTKRKAPTRVSRSAWLPASLSFSFLASSDDLLRRAEPKADWLFHPILGEELKGLL